MTLTLHILAGLGDQDVQSHGVRVDLARRGAKLCLEQEASLNLPSQGAGLEQFADSLRTACDQSVVRWPTAEPHPAAQLSQP